jgi:RNA polymerase sigma-70 factor (ECF subfamily)
LDLLAQVEAMGDLEFYPLLAAVRADLLRRAGRTDEAIVAYGRAIEQAGTGAERRLFQRRLDELTTRLRSPASGTSSAGNCKGE